MSHKITNLFSSARQDMSALQCPSPHARTFSARTSTCPRSRSLPTPDGPSSPLLHRIPLSPHPTHSLITLIHPPTPVLPHIAPTLMCARVRMRMCVSSCVCACALSCVVHPAARVRLECV